MLETAPPSAPHGGHVTARVRRSLPVGLGEAIGLFLILRIGLSLLALMYSAMEQLPGPCFQFGFDEWPVKPELVERGIGFQTLGVWERWDGCWYLRIATHGYGRYESGEPATAFFPAFPALTRAASELLGGRVLLGGLAVSGLAFVAAVAGLYRLVLRDFDRDTARRTCLYISIFPTAFFFFAPFTEALFLAAAVWTVYAARLRWWALAAAAAFLAGLTRIQGAVLVLPLAWEAALALRGAWRDGEPGRRLALRAARLAPAVAAPAVAVALFILYASTEGGMSPLEAQRRNWGSEWYPPWTVIRTAWDWSFNRTDLPWRDLQAINAFNLFVLLGFIALLAGGARRLPLSYTLFAAPQLLLVASRLNPTPLTSTARYVLVLFPAFVVLALLGRQRWLDQGWAVLSLLFLGFLTVEFLRNAFIA